MTKVLIIEDNTTVATLYRNTLRAAGFRVETAADGAKGLAAVGSFRPDLVLLDLMLPSIDGLTLLRKLRADPASTALPVIVFSNAFTGERLNDVWEAGATQVLAKASSSPKQVVEAVRATLADRAAQHPRQS
ncbi:MAG TPA: response regulator [Vicinamibacterales bacterium]|jgi:DNA-binding response OmpR family regulator